MKNLSLEEYQQKLVNCHNNQIDAALKCFSNESVSELYKKFDDIKELNRMENFNDNFDAENKLIELKYQVEQAELSDFRNIREKSIIESIRLKKKYIKRSKKIDENLKKVGKFIPSELFEKLKLL